MKKRFAILMAIFLILVVAAQSAFAATGDIISIKVGDQTAYNYNNGNVTNTDVYTTNLSEDITVVTNNDVDHVSIDGTDISSYTVSGSTYTFKYSAYGLSKGSNPIATLAYDNNNVLLDSVMINAIYNEKDEFYRNDDVFKSGSVTAFNGNLKLALGKDNFFKDFSDTSTSDTVMQISIGDRYNNDFGNVSHSLKSYSCVSPIYRIIPGNANSYRLAQLGTLTIKVDDPVPSTQYSKLAVIRSADGYFDDAQVMGGVASSSSKTITTDPFYDLPGYSYAVGMYNRDINADWADFSVTPLVAKGAIDEGLVDTNNLTSNTTRKDFAKMMVKGMGIPILTEEPKYLVFSDINPATVPNLNDRLYIETAAVYGIMKGNSNGTFNPGGYLTREEAAAVLANAAGLKLEDDENKVMAGLQKLYVDYQSISNWAGSAVMAVSQAKLMVGIPVSSTDPTQGNNFSPSNNLNYLQSATMVYNLMKKNKRL